MTFLEQLTEILHREEDEVLALYNDHLGKKTAGCGHLLIEADGDLFDAPLGTPISQEQSDAWFEQDVQTCINDARWLFPDLEEHPQTVAVVTSAMCFQMGLPATAGFKLFRQHIKDALEKNWMYAAAADEMLNSKWARVDTPARAERMAEMIRALAI